MEDIEYFVNKPGHVRNQNKKNKFGNVARSGATLRRNNHTNSSSLRGGRKHNSAILKHVSVTNEWNAQDVEDNFDFDDGGLVKSRNVTNVPTNRGKGVLTPISRSNNTSIIYSMNKRKRWLLPDMLKQEIEATAVSENKDRNIDVVVIERELETRDSLWLGRARHPDTVRVSSTVQSRDDDVICGRKRKYKRRKYAWSTDLLGLSQKRNDDDAKENTEEPVKPQVTYEVCRPQPLGKQRRHAQFSFNVFKGHRKSPRSAKREFHRVSREFTDVDPARNVSPQESNDSNDTRSADKRMSCSIDSWLQVTERSPKKPRKKTRHLQSFVPIQNHFCMKDRLVFETTSRETLENENNGRNSAELQAAESYWDKIMKQEEESSLEINVSQASIYDLDCRFPDRNLGNETSKCIIHGVTATRGCSRPVKYAFQLQDQISTKCQTTGEIMTATAYLTLESVSDPNKCQNRSCCYKNGNYCRCHDYLPMRVKTTILSEEEGHQRAIREWNEKLQAILRRLQKGNRGTYIEKIIKIASNTLKEYATDESNEEVKNGRKPVVSSTALAPYCRKVTDEAVALAGFSASQQCDGGLANELQKPAANLSTETKYLDKDETEELIVNCLPPDFCEICCVVLYEEEKAFRASAMAECKHWFCTDCWRQHVAFLARMSSAPAITCPAYECSAKVDDVTLMTLIPGDVISRHRSRQLQFVVKRSVEFYHCPSCNEVIKVQSPKTNNCLSLSCVCGTRWCSKCKRDPHWPATCDVAELYWKELETERNAQASIITSVMGRKCPNCREPMEKDGGCQMMTCVCGHVFCWKCMKPFDNCLYRCRSGMSALDTWDLKDSGTNFELAVRDAKSCWKTFQSYKQRKIRSKKCWNVACKIGSSYRTEDVTPTFSDKVKAAEEAEKELTKMLLFCDGLQHIMQYLVLAAACHKQSNKNQRAKLKGILSRLRLLSTNLERSIFTCSITRFNHLESLKQHFNKQAIPAKNLVLFLKSFLDNCSSC